MEAGMDAAVRRAMAHADFDKKFKHPLKFNGTDFVETKLSTEEQFGQLRKLLGPEAGSLHIFLERYGAMLEPEDVDALATTPAAETAESQIWLERLRQAPPSSGVLMKRARRRRWAWAKREMVLSSGYFSEDVMKHRDPKLFFETVGRHLQSNTPMAAQPMKGSLSSYLMQRLDQECNPGYGTSRPNCSNNLDAAGNKDDECQQNETAETPQKRARHEESQQEAAATKDEDDASEEEEADLGENDGDGVEVDIAEKRAQFLKSMRDRFVNGNEKQFNYTDIDADSDLDDLSELGQDAEERYFDAD
jgi:hypothetical protein